MQEQTLHKYAGVIIKMRSKIWSETEQITRCLWMKVLLLQLLTRSWSSSSEKEFLDWLNDSEFTFNMSATAFAFWRIPSPSYDRCTLCQIYHWEHDISTTVHISEEWERTWVLILYLVHWTLTTSQHCVVIFISLLFFLSLFIFFARGYAVYVDNRVVCQS